jgi:tetratricopeptide (TPR) repeat protein
MAVDLLEKAVELNPRSSEYYDWLGKAYGTQAQKAGKLKQPFLAKKTKDAWEKAIALDPNNLEAREDIIQYYLQAPGFLGGSKDKARDAAFEVRKRSPYRGAFVVANVCAEIKDQPCVEREMKSLIANFPDSSSAYSSLAAYYANAKDYERAFAVVEGRLKAKPSDPAALYSLGRTASLSGQNLERGEQALRAYIAAPLPTGPAVANAHLRLGMIAEKRGAKDVARREYQTALQLNPNLQDAKKALKALGG